MSQDTLPSPKEASPPVGETGRRTPRSSSLLAVFLALVLLLALARWIGPLPTQLGDPTGDAALAEAVRPRLSDQHRVTLALTEPGGAVRYAGFGAHERDEFEIGSVTKTFTGALLMRMVEQGRTTLDATVADILGEQARNAPIADITLRELASHTSGLPRGEDSLVALTRFTLNKEPFTGTPEQFLDDTLKMQPEQRGTFAYSNVGIALLGRLLEHISGTSYEQLLRQELLDPLDMQQTQLPPGAPPGVNPFGHAVQPFTNQALSPAGMLRSSAEDMSTWIREMQNGRNPGAQGLEPLSFMPSMSSGTPNDGHIGITWFLTPAQNGGTIIWHGGSTSGFTSFIGYHSVSGRGFVILSASGHVDLTTLGLDVLNGVLPA